MRSMKQSRPNIMRSNLGATTHVKNRGKKRQSPPVVGETKAVYRVKSKDVRKRRALLKFECDFLNEEKVNLVRNFCIVDALFKEAVMLGIFPLKNPLDGIEVDLKIAKVVNSV